jgi:hypothetical protein
LKFLFSKSQKSPEGPGGIVKKGEKAQRFFSPWSKKSRTRKVDRRSRPEVRDQAGLDQVTTARSTRPDPKYFKYIIKNFFFDLIYVQRALNLNLENAKDQINNLVGEKQMPAPRKLFRVTHALAQVTGSSTFEYLTKCETFQDYLGHRIVLTHTEPGKPGVNRYARHDGVKGMRIETPLNKVEKFKSIGKLVARLQEIKDKAIESGNLAAGGFAVKKEKVQEIIGKFYLANDESIPQVNDSQLEELTGLYCFPYAATVATWNIYFDMDTDLVSHVVVEPWEKDDVRIDSIEELELYLETNRVDVLDVMPEEDVQAHEDWIDDLKDGMIRVCKSQPAFNDGSGLSLEVLKLYNIATDKDFSEAVDSLVADGFLKKIDNNSVIAAELDDQDQVEEVGSDQVDQDQDQASTNQVSFKDYRPIARTSDIYAAAQENAENAIPASPEPTPAPESDQDDQVTWTAPEVDQVKTLEGQLALARSKAQELEKQVRRLESDLQEVKDENRDLRLVVENALENQKTHLDTIDGLRDQLTWEADKAKTYRHEARELREKLQIFEQIQTLIDKP